MNNTIMASYYAEVIALFHGRPDLFDRFDEYWKSHNYRNAYLFVQEAIERERIQESYKFKFVDKNFYWEFIA